MQDSGPIVNLVDIKVWEDGDGGWHWSWDVPGCSVTYIGCGDTREQALERGTRCAAAHYAEMQ